MSPEQNPPLYWIVATEVPALTGGARVRNYHLVRLLSRSFRVVVWTINHEPELAARLEAELGVEVRTVRPSRLPGAMLGLISIARRMPPSLIAFRRSGLSASLLRAARRERPDILQLEQVHAAYAAWPVLRRLRRRGVKIVLDEHNVEALAFEGSLPLFSAPKRAVGRWIAPRFRRFEAKALRRSHLVLCCSEVDESILRRMGAKTVAVIPNGVDSAAFALGRTVPEAARPTALFMGGMSYPPNDEALRYYFAHVHPLVLGQVPDLLVRVISKDPSPWLVALASKDPSIELLGFVPDVRPHLAAAQICICPILSGSGTRLKVLEYLGAGKAVVSTSKGAEGIGYVAGRDLLIGDAPERFAADMVWLLQSSALRRRIGEDGQALVRARYDWNVVGAGLDAAVRELTGQGGAR